MIIVLAVTVADEIKYTGPNDRVIGALIVGIGSDRTRRIKVSYNADQVPGNDCTAVIFVIPLFSDFIPDAPDDDARMVPVS